MKKYKNQIILSVIGAALICGLVACNTANTNTYRGVAVSQVGVQTALDGWNQAIPVLKPSTNTQYKVRAAFNKWKAGMLLVCDAGAAYAQGYGTTNEASLSGALEYAIANSAQDKADLLNLLSQVGVNVPTNSIP